MTQQRRASWFVRGDIDGFFGLALDNLVQLLLIDTLCRFVLGFSNEILYGRILPGVCAVLVTNPRQPRGPEQYAIRRPAAPLPRTSNWSFGVSCLGKPECCLPM